MRYPTQTEWLGQWRPLHDPGWTGPSVEALSQWRGPESQPRSNLWPGLDIKQDTLALARLVNWGSGDLFPQFGMPKLGWSVSGPGGLAQR